MAERQSAGMSKITNDGLTRSGTGCCTHMATVGVKGLKRLSVGDARQEFIGELNAILSVAIVDPHLYSLAHADSLVLCT